MQDVFALLGCHTELVGSYRRFGTAYRSHLKESRSFGLFDPWRLGQLADTDTNQRSV